MSLKEFWDEQAESWALFARTPGHDNWHEGFNFPAFLELLPPPGRATLDLGCGEGRVGAELRRLGHDVIGVDASETMVALASERHEALVADATRLPFEDASFDLVVAYMSVANFDDPEAALREVGRVLSHGGRFCSATLHPVHSAGRFVSEDPGAPFVIEGSYFKQVEKVWGSDRNGIRVRFRDRGFTLERLFRAHEDAGLVVEAVREPRPPDEFVQAHPIAARRRRVPLFLHTGAVKP
jgi:SAM-dependent methyltransferase